MTDRTARLVHALVCRDRMTPEAASERLSAYQVDMDAGAIEQLLAETSCPACERHGDRVQQPAGGREPARVHRSVASGWLTGQLRGDG